MIQRFAGRYELLRRLGQGGMGEVFLARDLATGAECALKRLTPRAGARLSEVRHEFEALSRLSHPAIVHVFDLHFAPDGTPFYTMEYVPGISADRAIARGDWPALFLRFSSGVRSVNLCWPMMTSSKSACRRWTWSISCLRLRRNSI